MISSSPLLESEDLIAACPRKHLSSSGSLIANMETDQKFLANVMELLDKIPNSSQATTRNLEEVSELDDTWVIEKFLPAASHHHSKQGSNFLQCLKGCFSHPNLFLMDFMLEFNRRKVLPLKCFLK